MLELEQAVERILAEIPPVVAERVVLTRAHRRVLAETVSAEADLPPFDNSAMDGYAVKAADLPGATVERPVTLKLAGRAAAGEVFAGELAAGECVRIFTGSPLPRGADAVVMQEETRVETDAPDVVGFTVPAAPWENVRFRGEDVKRGAILSTPGDVVTAGRTVLLGAAGRAEILVARRPIVGLLATGSELAEVGQALAPGKIHESNRAGLAALAAGAGAIPKILPIVHDTLDGTRTALEAGFAQCDALVTSGGVSVGEMDFVKAAFEQMGGRLDFWKVAIRPGRPFVFGRWQDKFLFGLPGNPVSAFVTFLLLVRPALRRWQGARDTRMPVQSATLAEPLANLGERRHFVRVRVLPDGTVKSAGVQASHIMSSLAEANGLVDLPPQTTLPAGANASVLRWEC